MVLEHRKYAIKNGLFFGLGYVIISLLFYFFDKTLLYAGNTYSICFWALFLLFPIYLIKNNNFELSNFKDFFSIIFLSFALAMFILLVFKWVLHNIIDPGLTDVYVNIMIEKVNQNPELAVNDMDEEYFANNFELKNQINAYVFFLIPCALYSAIISLIISTAKKKKKK